MKVKNKKDWKPKLTIAQEKRYAYMHNVLGLSKGAIARDMRISKTFLEHATAGW